MAAIPPVTTQPTPAVAGPARLADARAAFFRQALAATQAGPTAPAARAQTPAAPAAAPFQTAQAASDSFPERYARPGSIINIRV